MATSSNRQKTKPNFKLKHDHCMKSASGGKPAHMPITNSASCVSKNSLKSGGNSQTIRLAHNCCIRRVMSCCALNTKHLQYKRVLELRCCSIFSPINMCSTASFDTQGDRVHWKLRLDAKKNMSATQVVVLFMSQGLQFFFSSRHGEVWSSAGWEQFVTKYRALIVLC